MMIVAKYRGTEQSLSRFNCCNWAGSTVTHDVVDGGGCSEVVAELIIIF